MPPRRSRDRSPPRRIVPPSDKRSRSRPRDMDSHRPRTPSSSRASSRPKESSSSRPRDSRSSKSSQHRETRRGGGDQARTQTHRRQRSSASGSLRRSDHAPSGSGGPGANKNNRSPSRSSRRRRSVSTTRSSPAVDDQQRKNNQQRGRGYSDCSIQPTTISNTFSSTHHDSPKKRRPKNTSAAADHVDRLIAEALIVHQNNNSNTKDDGPRRRPKAFPSSSSTKSSSSTGSKHKDTKGHKKFNNFLSKISQVKERARSLSKDRRRSKQDIDPWSKDDTGISCRSMMNSTSDSTVNTKSSSGSSCPGRSMKSAPILTTKSIVGSVTTSKTSYSRPPPPPPPPQRSTHQPFLPVKHKSASTSALGISVENSGDAMSSSQPARPAVVRSKSREGSSSVGSSLYPRGAAPSPTVSVPPPRANSTRGRRSHSELSSSSSSILFRKSTPPPPPPPRRASMSSNNNNNTNGSIRKGSAIIPVTTNNAIVPATAIPTMFTNNKHQPKHRSSRISKKTHPVSSMEYTDPYGDSGIYSGEVDDLATSRPHGKGKMKYDNGIFYEGNWIHGYKDESQGNSSGDQYATNVTRERIMSGFTSWKGQKKKDGDGGSGDKGTFVYGMEWADYVGMSGKYTGHINADDIPNGHGVMRYEFGLVAEGNWIKGKLNDGGGGGMSNGVMAQSAAGGMSVAPGGMSVAGGAASVVSGLGMMSIGGNSGGGMMMGGYPRNIMGHNRLNTITPAASLAGAAYYNPAVTMAGGAPAAMSFQHQHCTMNHPASAGGDAHVPTNVFHC